MGSVKQEEIVLSFHYKNFEAIHLSTQNIQFHGDIRKNISTSVFDLIIALCAKGFQNYLTIL